MRLNDLRAAIIVRSEFTANLRALRRFQLCVLHEPYPLYSDYAFKTDFSSAGSAASVCDVPAQFKIHASEAQWTQFFVSARPLKF